MQPSRPLHLHRSKPLTCSYQVCVRTYHVCISADACTPKVCRFCAKSIIDLSPSSGSGVWDPWSVEYQSYDFKKYCSTETNDWLCFAYCCNIRALLFLLDADISVSNLFQYPETLLYLCVLSAVLLPIDPSPNSPFLQQCCPALNRRFRFRSVVPNLHHRISHGKLPWNKHEFTRLAH